MKQCAPIALLASDAAEARVRRFGLNSWSELFTPLADISVTLREPSTGIPGLPGRVQLDFRNIRKHGFLLTLTVLPSTLHEALLGTSTLEECEKRFVHFFERLVDPIEYETFRTFLSCIFVVAGCEEQPLAELSKLIQLQHTHQHGSATEAKGIAPSHCAEPKWRTTSTHKFYLLVHDVEKDDEIRTQDTYKQMCTTYGPDSCYCLKVGNGEGVDLPDIWRDVAEEADVVKKGIVRARAALILKNGEDTKDLSSISTISSGLPSPTQTTSFEPFSGSLLDTPRNVSAEDREILRAFIQHFADKSLVPYVDRLMRALLEAVSQRRGITRSLTGNVKKWFATPSLSTNATVSYTHDSIEMQNRRLADIFFEFGLYEKAHSQYQAVKKDFNADNASLHHAAALDMSAYSYFLSNSSVSAKNFPTHYFENALGQFLSSQARFTCALRCSQQAVEVLTKLELHIEAAMQLVKLTGLEMDHCVGVSLISAAACFERARMHRKAAFYRVLAGNRFIKSGLTHLAIEAYKAALQQYFERNWHYSEDYLASAIVTQSADANLAFSCARRLLRPANHQNETMQAQNITNFVSVVKKFGLDKTQRISLHLPYIDAQDIIVICGERPTTEAILEAREKFRGEIIEDHPWNDIQGAAYHALAGPSTAFRGICVVSDSTTDNARRRETPAGERFRVLIQARNPLAVPLTFYNVSLAVTDIEMRPPAPPNNSGFLETSLIGRLCIPANETANIEVFVRPCDTLASFRVSDLLLELEALDGGERLRGQIPLLIRGPRLNNTAEQRKRQSYASDNRLQASIAAVRWPLLDVQLEKPVSHDVFCGQAVRLIFKLQNIGDDDVSSVCLSTDGSDCVSSGVFDVNGHRTLAVSYISSANSGVRVLEFSGLTLEKGETRRVFVDLCAPQIESPCDIALLFLYSGSESNAGTHAHREQRIIIPLRPRALFAASSVLLDPAYGLIAIDVRNAMPSSGAALAKVEVLRISIHLAHTDVNGHIIEASGVLSLRSIRSRSVQLDCLQSDSICVAISTVVDGLGPVVWLVAEIPDCPSFPIPLELFAKSCIGQPVIFLRILWKGSVVNNHGQVSYIMGEAIVPDPYLNSGTRLPGLTWPELTDEDATSVPNGICITVSPLSTVTHDFSTKKLCEFPVEIRVRNDENIACDVFFKFEPKYSVPQQPPLSVDTKHQWWLNLEAFKITGLAPHYVEARTLRVRVAQPSVYDILGPSLKAVAVFSDGVERQLQLPILHACVIQK